MAGFSNHSGGGWGFARALIETGVVLTFENMDINIRRSGVWRGACVISSMLKLYFVDEQHTRRCRQLVAHFMGLN